jgi:DNA-binding response OmpR family regulator
MSKFKVLLVDDEREYVTTLGERMEMRGFEPEIAFSGEQALGMLEHSLPDVMVLDLKMPGIDGLEVLRRVKKRYPQIQVIILTGHGSDRDEAAARRLGAFDHLQKPVDINDLVHIMELAFHQQAYPGKSL